MTGISKVPDLVLKLASPLRARSSRGAQMHHIGATADFCGTNVTGTALRGLASLRSSVITAKILRSSIRHIRPKAISRLEVWIPALLAWCSYNMDTGGRTIQSLVGFLFSSFVGLPTFCLRRWHSLQDMTILLLSWGLCCSVMNCVFGGGSLDAILHRYFSSYQIVFLKRIDVRVWRGAEVKVN